MSQTTSHRAAQRSRGYANTDRAWQIYQKTLACLGLVQWFHDRGLVLSLNPPELEDNPQGCGLTIGDYRLNVITQGSWLDKRIEVPCAEMDAPEGIAHFYVWVTVQEEQDQVQIQGFLRYSQLKHHQQTQNWKPSAEGTYTLSPEWFDRDLDHLLLFLACLDPGALLPGLPSPTSPDRPARLAAPISPINVGLWLQDRLDPIAQALSWTLLPLFSPVLQPALRSPLAELETIMAGVSERMGTPFPSQARGAYHNLELAGHPLRLYAVTWAIESGAALTEWGLLTVVGAQVGFPLPPDLRLRISALYPSDGGNSAFTEQQLVDQGIDQELEPNPASDYLFAQVVGTLSEQFQVTLVLETDVFLTLPPFVFC